MLLVAFWQVDLRAEAPLAPVRILHRHGVAEGDLSGVLSGVLVFSMGSAVVFLVPLYVDAALGWSPLATGSAP